METVQLTWKDYLALTEKRAQQYGKTYALFERVDGTHREYREPTSLDLVAEPGMFLAEIFGEPIRHEGVIVATYREREDIHLQQDKTIALVTEKPWLYVPRPYPLSIEEEFPIRTRVLAPYDNEGDEGEMREGVITQYTTNHLPHSSVITGFFIDFEDGTEPVEFEEGFLGLVQRTETPVL